MAKRKSIAKRTRFEVFKRDKFTCQYCGRSAPEAILEIDHITPVASSGGNEILNLVTSCTYCNSGKGARELSDQSAITKQQAQLAELEERRQQLEMLLQWRESLKGIESDAEAAIEAEIGRHLGWGGISEHGHKLIRGWLRKYEFLLLCSAIDASADQYLEMESEYATPDEAARFFEMIPRIAAVMKSAKEKPHLKDLLYIRGIMRNRFAYCDEALALSLLSRAFDEGASIEDLRTIALDSESWSQWRAMIDNLMDWDQS